MYHNKGSRITQGGCLLLAEDTGAVKPKVHISPGSGKQVKRLACPNLCEGNGNVGESLAEYKVRFDSDVRRLDSRRFGNCAVVIHSC